MQQGGNMNKEMETTLVVNNEPIDLTTFPREFLTNVVTSAVSSLKGGKEIQDLELYQDQGNVKIVVNGNRLTITTFPNDVIANTINGLVSTLKGVDKVESLVINIKAP